MSGGAAKARPQTFQWMAGMLAGTLAGGLTAATSIEVTPLFGGGYRLVIETGHDDVAQVRALLGPRARQLCGDQALRWGPYQTQTVSLTVPPGQPPRARVRLSQDLQCDAADLLRAAPATTPRPAVIDAPTSDRQRIERINSAFFAARDRGDAMASWQLAGHLGLARFTSQAAWREQVQAFMQLAGGDIRRSWRTWTWYRDPPSAEPGLYVAVDFAADSRHLAALCGYALWRRRGDGNFDLVRLEENTIGREEWTRFRPDELEATLQRFRCK